MKKAKVRYIFTIEIDVPDDYTEELLSFQRNEGCWCAGNAIDELNQMFPQSDDPERNKRCCCQEFKCEVVHCPDPPKDPNLAY